MSFHVNSVVDRRVKKVNPSSDTMKIKIDCLYILPVEINGVCFNRKPNVERFSKTVIHKK